MNCPVHCGCPSAKAVTHCIFDLDGLMLDTESVYEKVYQEIARSYGKEYTTELKLKVIGRPELDGANTFVTELKIPLSGEEFLGIFKPICMERLQMPFFLPGVEKLIKHLSKHKIPMSIATSGHRDVTDRKMHHHRDILDLMDHVVCGSNDPEVKKGKPAPDIYLISASRFPDKPKPEKVLVFEDSPAGVEGAIAAGMQCVWVPSRDLFERMSKAEMGKATLTLESLEAFHPEDFGLPKYD